MFKLVNYHINNLPAYANTLPFIVARDVEGELWFYGAYDDEHKAQWVAGEVGGWVFNH